MREIADADRIQRLVRALSAEADVEVRVYFTGGVTAVLLGWRRSTIDVDLRMEPELDRLLRALPHLKEDLRVNIELASPADFIPIPEGWEPRSPFIATERVRRSLAKYSIQDARDHHRVAEKPRAELENLGRGARAVTDPGPPLAEVSLFLSPHH